MKVISKHLIKSLDYHLSNILLQKSEYNDDEIAKVGDFGISREVSLQRLARTNIGTPVILY